MYYYGGGSNCGNNMNYAYPYAMYPYYGNNNYGSNYAIIIVLFILLVIIIGSRFGGR